MEEYARTASKKQIPRTQLQTRLSVHALRREHSRKSHWLFLCTRVFFFSVSVYFLQFTLLTGGRVTPMTQAQEKHTSRESRQPTSFDVARMVVEASHGAKGQDVSVLDVREVFDMADYFIVVSGRSDRQSQGICNKILQRLEQEGVKPAMVEGFDDGHCLILVWYEDSQTYV